MRKDRAIAASVICLLLTAAAARADTASGLDDFRSGRFAEAFEQWHDAAGNGDARAALYVGVLYDAGLGVVHDETLALQWYRQAAEAGNATAAFNVGVMYDAGHGSAADPQQAAAWYARAASKFYPRAEYNLGLLYEAGIGVPRDRGRAVEFFTRAADHGLTAAQEHLAALGRPHDMTQRATERGSDDSPMLVFQEAQRAFLARGPAEAGRAVELFRRAAEQQNALAEYDLGYCYEYGIGVPLDRAAAYRWYISAINDAKDDAIRSIAGAGALSLAKVLNKDDLRNAENHGTRGAETN